MKNPLPLRRKAAALVVAVAAIAVATALLKSGSGQPAHRNPPQGSGSASNAPAAEATVDLEPGQLNGIKIEPVGTYPFPVEKTAVGSITFVDDLSVQVFPPNQGKIIKTFVELGDEVQKGQPLYTIDSPDLIQAESTLIGAAGTFELTSKELARAKDLYGTNGVSERELEQATSEQQAAEGALKAARDAVRVFGKTETEIDQLVATRKIDPALVVRSPVTGEVTSYNAPPGLLVQPGTPPAPFSVADVSLKWMLANVAESDSPMFRPGQPVQARVMAFPGRVFTGSISKIYAAVDPNTHRATVRSEIADPKHELRPGMLASFVIRVQDPVESVAIPMTGVVRNGDGTMAAWVTADRHRFLQRIIKVGLQTDGRYQVLEGLHQGELAATDGAIFLSNMLQAPPTD
ncbi:MAG TPA: efflux RND transporter periplasmic adaptor subunit [Candidatus Binatia bacterium]|jgi:cobalt-zinc-cadmium efflux system membrane fusion protein|nr:efflux RND transporter periplasmic adaptor subunit [Candidatus Binatia bacterium]